MVAASAHSSSLPASTPPPPSALSAAPSPSTALASTFPSTAPPSPSTFPAGAAPTGAWLREQCQALHVAVTEFDDCRASLSLEAKCVRLEALCAPATNLRHLIEDRLRTNLTAEQRKWAQESHANLSITSDSLEATLAFFRCVGLSRLCSRLSAPCLLFSTGDRVLRSRAKAPPPYPAPTTALASNTGLTSSSSSSSSVSASPSCARSVVFHVS